jgi:DNA-binding SARP family transcriptional activator/tetratricopeptide (TPR) repeat protein
MAKLEMALLGQPEFRLNGQSITHALSAKGQALLAFLAVTRQSHTRDTLVALLWDGMIEENGRRNLRVALTALRRPLDDFLVISRRTLAFNLESDYTLDTEQFETGLTNPNATASRLDAAVALYRGDFLAGLVLRDAMPFEEWVVPTQERLHRLATEGLHRLAHHALQQRHYSRSIDYAKRLLLLDPWHEPTHRLLMWLPAKTGDRNAALAQYSACCAVLLEELGAEPAPETTVLYHQILRGEPLGALTESADILPPLAAEKWSPPFQLPHPVRHFVGRQATETALAAALTTDSTPSESGHPLAGRIHAVVGMGGIGKTALATRIAHAVQPQFPDGILWANSANSEPRTILEDWVRLYTRHETVISDLGMLANAAHHALSGKRILIVLDDVASLARVRPLLPDNPGTRILLTTRDQDVAHALEARLWPLDTLRPENSLELMRQILGEARISAEPEAANTICDLLDHLPLAIEITAQRLKSRPRRRLADIAHRLRDETQRLYELALPNRAVRASFALSHASLDSGLQRTFALMGLFRGRSFTSAALAALTGQERYTVEDRIFTLIALSLAGESEDGRYAQHPLLADFAREMLGDSPDDILRFTTWHLDFARRHRNQYDALRPEWDNLTTALAVADEHAQWHQVIALAETLHEPWFTRSRYTAARKGCELAARAAARLNDPLREAFFLFQLGRACLEQKEFACAHTALQQGYQQYEALGEQNGMARISTFLSRLMLEQGQHDQAMAWLETGSTLCERLQNREGLAEVRHMEARAHFFRGNYAESARLAQQAVTLWKALRDPWGLMRTLNLMAAMALEEQQVLQAEQYARESLALAESVQAKGEQAGALDALAHVHRMRGEYEKARAVVQQNLTLLENIGDLGERANALYHLCRISVEEGAYEAALEPAEESLQLCQKLQYPLLELYVLNWQGDALKGLGRRDEALWKWGKALAIAKALPHPKAIRDTERRLAAV